MIFEFIDHKTNCNSCFTDNEIIPFQDLQDAKYSWDYHPSMGDNVYELACLYIKSKDIESYCSEQYINQYKLLKEKLRFHMKAIITANVSLNENCFFDLVPETFTREFFSLRSAIMKDIFNNFERPKDYDFLYEINKILYKISQNEVKLDLQNVSDTKLQVAQYKKLSNLSRFVKYDLFAGITGRLGWESNSFPIMNLAKPLRGIVSPTNHFLLELDFNAFEPRIMLSLNGNKQPNIDLHEWNKENIFLGLDRDSGKKLFLSWLYEKEETAAIKTAQRKKLNLTYNKEEIKKKYYKDGMVTNYYGRQIKADEDHSLNYTIQSTAADCFLRQVVKLNKLLAGKKSFIKFLIHDSIVIDMNKEDKALVKDMVKCFSETDFGAFAVNKKIGKSFGDMKELK